MSSASPDRADQEPEETPSALFKKMADNDAKQNAKLTGKLQSGHSNGVGGKKKDGNQPTKIRFFICTLGLISLAMSQMSRMVLNLSIPQMVDPSMVAKKNDDPAVNAADGSCPWPEDEIQATTPALLDLSEDNFDQVPDLEEGWTKSDLEMETTTTGLPIFNATTTSTTTMATPTPDQQYDRFMWTIKEQNVLLGGFYYSYFVFMVLGGRMAETYGAKYVLLLGVAGSALINLATPWLARNSFVGLVLSRVLMGAIQSGVFPAMYALIARWLTMSEASIFAPLIKMNLRLGMVLGSLVPGLVAGWPNVFYFTGVLSALWSVLWILLATSRPEDNRWVNELELQRILRKKKKTPAKEEDNNDIEMTDKSSQPVDSKSTPKSKETPKKTPWLKLLTSPSVIGLIVVKLTFNYALDFLAIELPSYLKYVHHVSKEKISAITTPMFAIQVVLIVFVGWLAKIFVQRRPLGMSKTTIRKLFQCTASFGIALGMFLITFNDCNLIYIAILLQFVSFLSMFTAGGETMLPYDLSEEYPATIMAIANSVANVSAITTTTLAGLILGNEGGSYARWNILMYLIVGANLVGGSVFLLLVKAEPIELDKKTRTKADLEAPSAPPEAEVVASPDGVRAN